MLDISTAHVDALTACKLDGDFSWDTQMNPPVIAYQKEGVGWWLYVPSEPGNETDPAFPPELRACMELARKHDCDWIMFDKDSPVIDELEAFDW